MDSDEEALGNCQQLCLPWHLLDREEAVALVERCAAEVRAEIAAEQGS